MIITKHMHSSSDAGRRLPRRSWASAGAWLIGLASLLMILVHLGGERASVLLRYERAQVLQGEWWRLITAHLAHGDARHLLLNLAGLVLLGMLFAGCYSLAGWLVITLCSLGAIGVGFVFYEPQLDWYVGLSGILHGLLAAGALAWWQRESRLLALALSLVVAGKLGWEQWQGALALSGSLPVVVNAHLYGALGGLVGGALIIAWQRLTRSGAQGGTPPARN